MMGPEYFTTGAYIHDGSVLCPTCGDEAGLPVSDQITEAQLWESFGDCAADGGMHCDRCDAVLVEADETLEDLDEDNEVLGEEDESADFEDEA